MRSFLSWVSSSSSTANCCAVSNCLLLRHSYILSSFSSAGCADDPVGIIIAPIASIVIITFANLPSLSASEFLSTLLSIAVSPSAVCLISLSICVFSSFDMVSIRANAFSTIPITMFVGVVTSYPKLSTKAVFILSASCALSSASDNNNCFFLRFLITSLLLVHAISP